MSENSVALCYLHPSDYVATAFHHSMLALCMRDISGPRMLMNLFPGYAGAMGLPQARNKTTRTALDAGAEWVFWVDADMGFDPDTLDRLLAVADPEARPVVGGLAFAQLYEKRAMDDQFHPETTIAPTLYSWVAGKSVFERWSDWPRGEIVEVDATGAAMILIHRTVFEAIADDAGGDCWFTPVPHPDPVSTGFDHYGEDVSFCLRVRGNGYKIAVDTSVKTSHLKPRWLTDEVFDAEALEIPNFAVIPTKGTKSMVRDLVTALILQDETSKIFVLDNGCSDHVVNWLDSQEKVERIEMPGAGIHEMWNRGIQSAQRIATRCNIAILNDDIRVGDGFVSGLAAGLRARWDVGVVGPNYDGRDGTGLLGVAEICANRYDGTGGLPGFAFMVRGESCYLFPPEMKWWYGDNDLLYHHLTRNRIAGLALDVTCEHLDGGSQTGDWDDPEMAAVLDADRQAFEARWGHLQQKQEVPA